MVTDPAPDESRETEHQRHRAEMAETRPAWYSWLVFVVIAVTASGASVMVSKHDRRESEQAWCDVVVVLNDGFVNPEPSAPPLNARGKKLAAGIAKVSRDYDC
jgi:hypothetical protein